MKPSDYYANIEDRVFAWKNNLTDNRFAPFQAQILPLVAQVPAGGRVLDIGCQAGHMLNLIQTRFDEA
jgi:trans-aconitate methyltransferase